MRRILSISLIYLLGFVLSMRAQVETTSGISGTVTDPSGAVISGASVTLRNQNTGATREGATNASGSYSFPSVLPGTYTVKVELPGFKTALVTDRVVEVTQPARVDVALEIGETTEIVTVSAEGAELITTATAEISGTVNQTLVDNIPLNGRNFFNLAALTPGTSPQYLRMGRVSFAESAMNYVSGAGTFVSSGVFAGGARDSAANVSIDGSNVQSSIYGQTTQLQSPSTVQEVKIQSGNMNAEFGNGVAAVNVITKSGTNEYHGEVYEFLRNDNLDANGFFTNLAGRELPEYKQNQFGGTFGGPILKNKLLFFGNYEGFRVRQSTQSNTIVPPQALRNGDFSSYRPPLPGGAFGPTPTIFNPYRFDPVTGLREPFPGNKIPLGPTNLCSPRPTCVDPVALALLGFTPPSNTVIDGIPQFSGPVPITIDRDQFSVRLDWQKSANTQIYGRYTFEDRFALAEGLLPLQGTDNSTASQNAVIHWAQVINPVTVNDLAVSYTRPAWLLGRNLGVPDVSKEIGLKNTSNSPGGPNLSVPGFALASSGSFVLDSTQNTYQFKDDFSTVKGRHNLKFGIHVNEKRLHYFTLSNDKGHLAFTDFYTRACPLGNAACVAARNAAGLDQGGLGFADYLLGAAQRAFLILPVAIYEGHQRYYGFYAQDSWQIHPRLTLNYGLRYEYWSPWLVPRNTVAQFDRSTGELLYALQNPLDTLNSATDFGRKAPLSGRIPREGYKTGNKNFSPRMGLAYLLTQDTTVRASGGIFYDGNWNMNQFSDTSTGVAPFNLRYDNVVAGNEQTPPQFMAEQYPVPSATAIPQPFSTPRTSFRAIGFPEYKIPTVYQWSFSVQRRLSTTWSLSLDYLGTHTINQFQFVEMNPADLPVGDKATLSLQDRRIFQQWASIGGWQPLGWAKYNGFTASVKNTGWRGLTVIANYAWAKNLASSNLGFSDIGHLDFRIFDLWAGPVAYTPPHRFVSGWSYQLPFGEGKTFALAGALKSIFGGWNLSGITEFSMGSPQPVFALDTSGTATTQLANRVAGCNASDGPRDRFDWFNTKCFAEPPFATFGTSQYGIFNEPGINNWDMTLSKSIPMKVPNETGRLDVRLEAFNVFNQTQWALANQQMTSSSFGRIGSTRPARQLQIALRFIF